ncbi:MAG: hypothetical protein ABIO70_25560 [Pseudomonadota bacterium]
MPPFTIAPEHFAGQDASTEDGLRAIAAFVRIQALACIMSARHGWIGASFSVAEILTALYFGLGERQVVLSKGHAAAAQYACLHGLGGLSREQLLAYQDGPGAPQAHADRTVPGILLDSGSLGQALSQVVGLVLAGLRGRVFVILGDGELQEGQCWEALQSVQQRGLLQIEVIIDVNGFQSARRVADLKRIPDLAGALRGLGFTVTEVDGHDPVALVQALEVPPARPRVLLARTLKAGGSRFLVPEGEVQPWHGRVPPPDVARGVWGEQVALASDPAVSAAFARWEAGAHAMEEPRPSAPPSTRDAVARRLPVLLDAHPELCVIDADLCDSCGLGPLFDPAGPWVRRGQAFQVGISEQDMVSCAGGLALGGRLPLVNTYAAFLARAVEQARTNASMGARVVYLGQYAGLGYFTDGKSHQALDDLLRFQGIPGLTLLEPCAPRQAAALLDWALGEAPGAVYLRLHRTGLELPLARAGHGPFDGADPRAPLVWGRGFSRCLVTMGPVATRLGIEALAEPDFAGWGLVAVCAPDEREPAAWERLLAPLTRVVTIEETWAPGVLRPWIDDKLLSLGLHPARISLHPRGFGVSFRTLEACRAHFGFTVAGLRGRLEAGGWRFDSRS